MYKVHKAASRAAPVLKSPPASAGDKRHRLDPWVGKIPWKKAWQLTPVFSPGKSHGQRNLAATVHRAAQSRTQLGGLARTQRRKHCEPVSRSHTVKSYPQHWRQWIHQAQNTNKCILKCFFCFKRKLKITKDKIFQKGPALRGKK